MSEPANRGGSGDGRFKPGQSGNPSGRPKTEREFIDLARARAPEAIERLAELAKGRGLAAVKACELILERAYGKAPLAVNLTARTAAIPGEVVGRARQRLEGLVASEEARKAGALAAVSIEGATAIEVQVAGAIGEPTS